MKIVFGCDNRGYTLKNAIISHLKELGHEVIDVGTDSAERVDYPAYGEKVARLVADGTGDLGVLVCGTGFGISLAANQVKGIRAVNCSDTYTARLSRMHNDANIVSIGSMVVGEGLALDIIDEFLTHSFIGGRHTRRVAMIKEIRERSDKE